MKDLIFRKNDKEDETEAPLDGDGNPYNPDETNAPLDDVGTHDLGSILGTDETELPEEDDDE
jgi:hypothetical protein